MKLSLFLKILAIHFLAKSLAYASASSWAFQQIETEKAWELAASRGSKITVAVVDTGADLTHPDLKDSLWENPGEIGYDVNGKLKAKNGIDDDQNGFVDDVHGWNFVRGSNDLKDENGHGTHIAGIIGARNKSGFGIDGVAPEAKLMILKYYDPSSPAEVNLQNTIKAFHYAIQMKAHIINFSGGGPGFNSQEEAVLKLAEQKNILLVAAAGNDGANTDIQKYYPADYELSNIISVTALNKFSAIPFFGNFGINTVHIAAPGEKILSTLPHSSFGEMSGTSQATAFVTGALAVLMSTHPEIRSAEKLKEKLIQSGPVVHSLIGKTKLGSALNLNRALLMKSTFESAAGFLFDNFDEFDTQSFTIPATPLDPFADRVHVEANERTASFYSF